MSAPTDSFLQHTDTYADLEFDVTDDVIAGGSTWILMKRDANVGINQRLLRLFSREGAPDADSAPRLIIEVGG